jgi:membrane protein
MDDAPGLKTGETNLVRARVGRAINRTYGWLANNRATRLPWAVIQTFSRAEGALLSGSLAYYTFLALPPLLMVAGAILGVVAGGATVNEDTLIGGLARNFPGGEGPAVLRQLGEAKVTLGIFGIVTLSYAASGFMGALTGSLNRIWGVHPGARNPLGQKLLNLSVVGLLGMVLLGSMIVTIWVRYVVRAALGSEASPVAVLLDRIAGPLSLFLLLLVVYRMLPARPLTWRSQIPGAVLGAAGTELLKALFGFWARHSAGVAALPRSILSAVLVLLWLGFVSQVVLYGASLNAVLAGSRDGRPTVDEGRPPPQPSS